MTLPAPNPAFRWTAEVWGPALRCVPLDAVSQHVFTSKHLRLHPQRAPGGSGPQLAQLTRMGSVASGWDAALSSVGGRRDQLIRVRQVHGRLVRVVVRDPEASAAHLEQPDGDAIVCSQPGMVLAVVVADCVPILVADGKTRAAAAVHAGWRGTCARVGPSAIDALRRDCGTDPADCIAAIGPSIGPDDYEVGHPLRDAFRQAGHTPADVDRWFRHIGSRLRLDLWTANRDQLVAAGLRPDRIFTCGLSTLACRDVFESHRADGESAGRMAALIVVPA